MRYAEASKSLPNAGEVLYRDFMRPLGLSSYRVAKEIDVPTSRIQDILHGRRRITADTALRLSRLFGVEDNYFLYVQADIDIERVKYAMEDQLCRIDNLNKPK